MSSHAARKFVVSGAGLAACLAAFLFVTKVWGSDPDIDLRALSAERPAAFASGDERRSKGHVILVTLDGARWQDVFHQRRTLGATPVLPRLLAAARANGAVRSEVTSSQLPLSLPGYQAIYAGRTTECRDNSCPGTTDETLIDALGADAAVFASWGGVPLAFRAGTGAHVDAPAVSADEEAGLGSSRPDSETIAAALVFLHGRRPRFLHLALLDMDSAGHDNDADAIVAAMRQSDQAIGAILDEIATWPADERRLTTLVVTADHGRGPGPLWQSHSLFAAARWTFVVAVGDLVGPSWSAPAQADLRPAIERLLGERAP